MPLAMRPLREENGALPAHFASRPRHSLRRRRLARGLRPVQVWLGGSTPNKYTWNSSTPRISLRGSQAHPRISVHGSSSTLLDKVRESPVFYGHAAYFSYASGRRDGADKAVRDSLLRRAEGCTPPPHPPCGCRYGECGCSRRLCRARWRGRHTWGRTL